MTVGAVFSLGTFLPAAAQDQPTLPYLDTTPQVDLVTGTWVLRRPHDLYADIGDKPRVIGRLSRGATVQATALAIRTLETPVYHVNKPLEYEVWNWDEQGGRPETKLQLTPGDKIVMLSYYGEGECRVWIKGGGYIAFCPGNYEANTLALDPGRRENRTEVWAKVTTSRGVVGYLKDPRARGMSKYD